MQPYLLKEATRYPGIVLERIVEGSADNMSGIADASVDAVVGTLVLCSADNVPAVLHEVARVLKPGGRYLFIEHVAARQGSWLRSLQSFVRPVWRLVGDGCEPDRDTGRRLREAPFTTLVVEEFNADQLGRLLALIAPHIVGVATK